MQHSPEFRRRAVDMARTSGRSVDQLALDLGISPTTLRQWVRRAEAIEPEAPAVITHSELESLKRQVGNLIVEVEVLKRATAYGQ